MFVGRLASSLAMAFVIVVTAAPPSVAAETTSAATCDQQFSVIPSSNHSTQPGEIDTLSSVDALSATDQWAVGSWLQFPNMYTFHTLVEHWNGTSVGWTTVASPNSSARNSYLYDVDAIASDNVWAVGGTDQSGPPYQSLVEHWDGSSWSIVTAASFPGVLYSVVAIAPGDIWAVGNRDYPGPALIEHWDGAAWTATYLRTAASLRSVAATAGDDVWAVGYEWGLTGITAGIEKTFAVHFNGRSWIHVPSPSPLTRSAQDQNWLTSVTSVGAGDVWAVGWFGDFDRGIIGQTLIEHFNGARWTVVASPNPPAQPGGADLSDSLWGVAAFSSTNVWAVGSIGGAIDVHASTVPLLARWNGVSWTAVPAAANQTGQMLGVAVEPGGTGVSVVGDWDTTVFVSTLAEHACLA